MIEDALRYGAPLSLRGRGVWWAESVLGAVFKLVHAIVQNAQFGVVECGEACSRFFIQCALDFCCPPVPGGDPSDVADGDAAPADIDGEQCVCRNSLQLLRVAPWFGGGTVGGRLRFRGLAHQLSKPRNFFV